MAEAIGATAAAMAAAPLASPAQRERDSKARKNPILTALGKMGFRAGDGRKFPRQSGWGASKKDHPDGGTNETVAYVVFQPFGMLADLPIEGRIYREQWSKDGKEHRKYSISLPFLGLKGNPRLSAETHAAINHLKLEIKSGYQDWAKSNKSTVESATVNRNDDDWDSAAQ
jgi:hypothetical protein